jgi:hypothetical protein
MIVVTLVSVGCGWFGALVRRANIQKAAVDAILKGGGRVSYDYQRDWDNHSNDIAHPPGPDWLRNLLGEHLFVTAVAAEVYSDEGARHFEDLPKLEYAILLGPHITDRALTHLVALHRLENLCIAGYLGDCQVTDTGLQNLRGLAQLKYLNIAGAKVTDAGMVSLGDLTQLESLGVTSTHVTCAGLEALRGLKHFRVLTLSGNEFTDVGLDRLGHLSHLQYLHLDSTLVTDAGIAKLQQALPKCKIER